MEAIEYSEQARQARNEYQRAWRRKNPQKQRGYLAKYWQKKFDNRLRQLTIFDDLARQEQPQKTADQLSILMPR
jgi:hypothetical protein